MTEIESAFAATALNATIYLTWLAVGLTLVLPVRGIGKVSDCVFNVVTGFVVWLAGLMLFYWVGWIPVYRLTANTDIGPV